MILEYRQIGWWYWLAATILLATALAGHRTALSAFTALNVVQAVHFALRFRRLAAFPVQTRATYLLIGIAGLWPPLAFLHWLLLTGTAARVLTGYCVLARTLSLLPVNRSEPLSARLVRRTFLTPPMRGSILAMRPSAGATGIGSSTARERQPAPGGGRG